MNDTVLCLITEYSVRQLYAVVAEFTFRGVLLKFHSFILLQLFLGVSAPDCRQGGICDPFADCIFSRLSNSYICKCRPGYTGDGIVCLRDTERGKVTSVPVMVCLNVMRVDKKINLFTQNLATLRIIVIRRLTADLTRL